MRAIYSEIVTIVRILLVIPVTNATSERFSAPRRVKTCLRSTMTQTRLNSIMSLHVLWRRSRPERIRKRVHYYRNERQQMCRWEVLISHVILGE